MFWLVISVVIVVIFVGYFMLIWEFVFDLMLFELLGLILFWVFFFIVVIYVNVGWCCEKVCLYMCLYGWF